jgi:hypothetical protein
MTEQTCMKRCAECLWYEDQFYPATATEPAECMKRCVTDGSFTEGQRPACEPPWFLDRTTQPPLNFQGRDGDV